MSNDCKYIHEAAVRCQHYENRGDYWGCMWLGECPYKSEKELRVGKQQDQPFKVNNKEIVCWDLETTGLSGFEDKVITLAEDRFSRQDVYKEWNYVDHKQFLLKVMKTLRYAAADGRILVSYNGENWRGGFDVSFLRSQCIKYGVDWTLKGVQHLDLLPLVKNRISTHHYISEPPSKSNLYKADLERLAEANGLEYTNKNETYDSLTELEDCDWLDYIEEECKQKNGLQTVYQLMFDPNQEEDYLSGADVPELFEAKDYDPIVKHNNLDVIRLRKVAEAVLPMIPQAEIDKNISIL